MHGLFLLKESYQILVDFFLQENFQYINYFLMGFQLHETFLLLMVFLKGHETKT